MEEKGSRGEEEGGAEEKRGEEQKEALVLNARSTCEPRGQRSTDVLLNAEVRASWSWWEVLGGWRRRSYGSSASGDALLTRADVGLSCCCSSLHLSCCCWRARLGGCASVCRAHAAGGRR